MVLTRSFRPRLFFVLITNLKNALVYNESTLTKGVNMRYIVVFLSFISMGFTTQAEQCYPQPQYQAPPAKYNQAPPQYYQDPPARYNQTPPRNYQAQPRRNYAEPKNYDPYYNNPPPRYYKPRRKKKKRGFRGFNFSNPKKSMSDMWDDGWEEPANWGDMPGGWSFPDVSLPNPVDTVDDFGDGMQDLPKGFQQDNRPTRSRARPRPRYSR